MSETAGPPKIFDRALLRRRLRRALSRRAGFPDDARRRRSARSVADGEARISARARSRFAERHFAQAVVASGRARPLRAGGHAGDVIADEEAPPFAPGSFDLIVSGMSLQWVNDLPGALAQARRMLAPDGLFLACLAGGASLVELRAAFTQAEEEITGGASPRVSPFVDVRDMGGLLQRAGFALPVADIDSFTLRYELIFGLMKDLRAMGAANVLVKRSRKPLRRDVVARAAQIYAERFSTPTDACARASKSSGPRVGRRTKPAKAGEARLSRDEFRRRDEIAGESDALTRALPDHMESWIRNCSNQNVRACSMRTCSRARPPPRRCGF